MALALREHPMTNEEYGRTLIPDALDPSSFMHLCPYCEGVAEVMYDYRNDGSPPPGPTYSLHFSCGKCRSTWYTRYDYVGYERLKASADVEQMLKVKKLEQLMTRCERLFPKGQEVYVIPRRHGIAFFVIEEHSTTPSSPSKPMLRCVSQEIGELLQLSIDPVTKMDIPLIGIRDVPSILQKLGEVLHFDQNAFVTVTF